MIILKPWAVYNEIEEYAADWLENLVAAGHIAPGVVDRRSIVDVRPDDYRGFRQAHFFAGIGVWSYALRRAGVPDDVALWTGSAPCQPFSAAGARGGLDDERHLWPHWLHLISAARPPRIYGEQVASKDGLGWLDLVQADLEAEGYTLWAVDTCSAGSGAPHIRQRLRLYAEDLGSSAGGLSDASRSRWGQKCSHAGGFDARDDTKGVPSGLGTGGLLDRLADNLHQQRQVRQSGVGYVDDAGRWLQDTAAPSGLRGIDRLVNSVSSGLEGQRDGHCSETRQRAGSLRPVAAAGGIEWVADDSGQRVRDQGPGANAGAPCGVQGERLQRQRLRHDSRDDGGNLTADLTRIGSRPTDGFWADADWLFCRDGKWRPTQPGIFPLVDGSTFRMGSGSPFEGKSRQGMLKGYGNAIDAEATVDFIEATLEPDTIDTDATDLAELL